MPPLEPYKLNYKYDDLKDILTIEGIKYSGEFFRALAVGGLAVGKHLKIIERKDSTFTIQEIHDRP